MDDDNAKARALLHANDVTFKYMQELAEDTLRKNDELRGELAKAKELNAQTAPSIHEKEATAAASAYLEADLDESDASLCAMFAQIHKISLQIEWDRVNAQLPKDTANGESNNTRVQRADTRARTAEQRFNHESAKVATMASQIQELQDKIAQLERKVGDEKIAVAHSDSSTQTETQSPGPGLHESVETLSPQPDPLIKQTDDQSEITNEGATLSTQMDHTLLCLATSVDVDGTDTKAHSELKKECKHIHTVLHLVEEKFPSRSQNIKWPHEVIGGIEELSECTHWAGSKIGNRTLKAIKDALVKGREYVENHKGDEEEMKKWNAELMSWLSASRS
ncbi:hypothetical protein BKA66DRAFT_577012 [Pyrenochaeta sp. MPI-SDFR-AT-0127]|nr:hypothetical protein BKA66DRAFT_577012 [Pyrenochaeta sp. MPI-SDFR-AT-0127]